MIVCFMFSSLSVKMSTFFRHRCRDQCLIDLLIENDHENGPDNYPKIIKKRLGAAKGGQVFI